MLIFGGSGYLGRAIIDRFGVKNNLLIYSRDEAKHWELHNSIRNRNFRTYIGDIRNRERVSACIHEFKPQYILIVSAMKQIPACETQPHESILTNIIGIQNIIDTCLMHDSVEKCLFISSDKACSPVNVYGMCKAIAEKIMTAASLQNQSTKFLTVRYGNVLNSTGSIVPLFKKQCQSHEHITVTDVNMTRFVMTYNDSLNLIEDALTHSDSGDIWIPILPSMRVIHLAEIFSEKYNVPIRIVGIRPGEKIDEELVNSTEGYRTIRQNESYYVIKPSFSAIRNNDTFIYNSRQRNIAKSELLEQLERNGLITKYVE